MKTITLTTKENVTFKVTARKKEVSTDRLGDYHQVYTIVIERNGEKKNFTFHDSTHNYNIGKEADNQMLIDAVYCITCDCFAAENNPTFIEFANEFNYGDEQRGEARRAFNSCHASLNKMLDLFSMDTIYDINWSITEEKIRVEELDKKEDEPKEDWLDHAHEVLDAYFPEIDSEIRATFACEYWQNGNTDEKNLKDFEQYIKDGQN